jgi:UDP-N-acetylmuramyl pentapeptide synthase
VVLATLDPGDAVLVKASRAAGLDVLVAEVAARE